MEVSTPASGAAAAEDMDAVVERLAAGRRRTSSFGVTVHANQELCNQELHTAAFITYTPQRAWRG